MADFIISVSQLNSYVEEKLYSDTFLNDIYIKGELSGVNARYNSVFFSLKDSGALIDCMLFDFENVSNVERLADGEKIVAHGSVSIYKKTGKYRLLVKDFYPCGEGEILKQLNELKAKLEKLGYFDAKNKKPLPKYPRSIGIVTSPAGAAIRDIITVCGRRDPTVKMTLYPAKVQGENAAQEIAKGIKYLDDMGFDLIVFGRGGGSNEDLSAFNDESLVQTVYEAKTPTVSAVGHETDFSLCDFAADMRAPTPSAAMEMCIPRREDILKNIYDCISAMKMNVFYKYDVLESNYRALKAALDMSSVSYKTQNYAKDVQAKITAMQVRINELTAQKRHSLERGISSLEVLNPYAALKRGYAVIKKGENHITSAENIAENDEINILLKDGEIHAKVIGKDLNK